MTFVWIAMGGALGSVCRAWLALAVARLTGPEFPWGTILINVVGSFVIGGFGALTAASGRLPLPLDARAFVMVGICGGFTTFSSFSLQTLDLLRDGRAGQALANVALSLCLCLASVAAGHYAASSLPPARTAAWGGGTLAVLDRPDTAARVLAAAGMLTRGGGRVDALELESEAADTRVAEEEISTRERPAAGGADMHAVRTEWSGRAGAKGEWRAVRGDPAALVAEHAAGAGFVVIGLPAATGVERPALHAALFDIGRPVLLLPPDAPAGPPDTVAVFWRAGDAHAAAAVRDAAPLLRGARRILLLEVAAEAGPAPPEAMAAERVTLPPGGDLGTTLLAAARDRGATLLVMGAYATRGEGRERLLGGTTETVLRDAAVPLLLRHVRGL